MGNDEVFRYSDGTRVFVIHDSAALNSISMGRCDEVTFAPLTPTGFANCQDVLVSSFPGFVTGGSFPTMAVDSKGGLFAVWEQAPGTAATNTSAANITGNTVLMYSTSTDEGNTWTLAKPLPTPGLANEVFAWPGAGDPLGPSQGKIDVAFYGTPAQFQGTKGPDSTVGDWGLWMVQTVDGGASWSAPVLASEHFIHHGTIQTLIGGQSGDRTLGDFLQLRIGSSGEAEISYSDSNNIDESTTPEAMYVRQNSGPSVFASVGTVNGVPAPTGNCVTDQHLDATFDANGVVGVNQPNLDIWQSCITASASSYTVTMQVADLTSLAPPTALPGVGGSTLIWQTQWHVPSTTDAHGGKLFMVYMESIGGQPPTCWVGENATTTVGGGVALTYPGLTQLTGTAACSYTVAAPGVITIVVPKSDVSEPGALDANLYSVTASTQTLPSGNAETPSPVVQGVNTGIGGQLFNLIDVAPAYDFNPGGGGGIREVPWTPLFLILGVGAGTLAMRRRRRFRWS
jgi:hypothetical protein